MNFLKKIACAGVMVASLGAGSAAAAPILLDFEGVADFALVNGFYNGGTDSAGNSGPNYGVNFSSDSIGLIDADFGGNGSIAGMPSSPTVLAFLSGGGAVFNVAAGFDTRLAFYYSAFDPGLVSVYDGLNGTGNLLAMISLGENVADCFDPDNVLCRFSPVEILFAGTARSVILGGPDGSLAFDNISLGALDADPDPGQVPEPASLALSALGLAGLALGRRKARKPQ